MKYNQPNNIIRKLLFGLGIFLHRVGLARAVIGLSPNRVRAILYHAVDPVTTDWTEGLGVNVTPDEFAANLDFFKAHYNVIDVMDTVEGELPKKPLVITFDDGYQSVADFAAPALIERAMPATVYLISRAVNGEMVWVNLLNRALSHAPEKTFEITRTIPELANKNSNREVMQTVQETFQPTAIEDLCEKLIAAFSLDVLTPDEPLYMSRETILDLQKQNIQFGFHTKDHFNMSLCTSDDLAKQLDSTSITDCINSRSFAYPFGYFHQQAVKQVESQGYDRIMTVGNNNSRFSPVHTDRIEIFTASPAQVFAHIEVVEPIISMLRRIVLTVKGRYNTHAPSSTANNEHA